LRDSLAVLKRRPGFYLGVAAIPSVSSSFFVIYFSPLDPLTNGFVATITWAHVLSFLLTIFVSLAWAAIAYVAYWDLRGVTITASNALRRTSERLVVILLIWLPLYCILAPGSTLFRSITADRFPLVWAMGYEFLNWVLGVVLAVAIPPCIVERRLAFRSLSRGWELTRDHRMAVLALWFIVFMAFKILWAIFMMIVNAGLLGTASLWIGLIALSVLSGSFQGILGATLYSNLSAAKNPSDTREIISVFD